MKKLLALILVLTLVLSMGVGAFATKPVPTYEDSIEVKIDKNLVSQGENPEEVFNFTVGVGSYSGPIENPTVPVINGFSITVGEKETSGFTNINLPEFTAIGVYTYEISETPGSTAGFVYDGETYYLVVTVLNDGQEGFIRVLTLYDGNDVKTDAFQNEFSAGDLTIKKEITGNYSDPNDEFEVTVTIRPPDEEVIKVGPIVWNTDDVTVDEGEYTAVYKLKGGESVTIQNLPYGVSYEVVETDAGEYDVEYDDNAEGEMDAAAISTTITNERNMLIDTGINLDNLPYILILVGAAVGLVAFTMKRRLSDDR